MGSLAFALVRWVVCTSVVACASACATPPPPAPERPRPRPALAPVEIEPLARPIVVRDVGFSSPDSVLHDVEADLYLVSNHAGNAAAADDRAFISRVEPSGRVVALKWIDAADADVELHAPKGMAIAAGVLYVADIDRVRKFDRETGRSLGAVRIEGASFLNDVAAEPSGVVYVSDSGLGPGLSPSGSDAIYRISVGGRVQALARGPELGQPSGIWLTPAGLYVVTLGSGELLRIGPDGAREHLARFPKGSLDGLVVSGEHIYVSSWEGSVIYDRVGETIGELASGIEAAADLGIDQTRRRLLVTHYNGDRLSIHSLP